MTTDVCQIDVPLCSCVKGARELSTVFAIPSKYRTEGSAVGAGVGTVYGSFIVRCDWCGTVLKYVEAHEFVKPIELYESSERK
jgi:hypothetical protein